MGRLAALALLAVIGLALPLAGEAAYPGRNGLIVFSSERADRSLELFTMRPDGSRQRRLTHEAPLARDPAWSPDGKKLAFDHRNAVYVLPLTAKRPVLILRNASQPAWSPDGRKLAFVRILGTLEHGNAEIYVADANGTHAWGLTFNPGTDAAPDWQPLR